MGILFPFTLSSLLGYMIKNRRPFLTKCSEKKTRAFNFFVSLAEISQNFQDGDETQVT